jgi:ribosomal protein L2
VFSTHKSNHTQNPGTGEHFQVKFQNRFKKVRLLIFALLITSFAFNYAYAHKAATVEYTYKVHNKSRSTITALLASEDGKTYGAFDIGKGIAPGQTVTLVWDKSTDEGNCEQWIKAKFADGGVSPAAKFDFCEADLVLEFE